jgi:hypothetical protein
MCTSSTIDAILKEGLGGKFNWFNRPMKIVNDKVGI